MTELLVSSRAQSNIDLPQGEIADFCRRWNVAEFALFGSVLRDDFRPNSDVDVLVSFAPDFHWSLGDFVDMQLELSEIFGRQVDLVERSGLHNPFMRREILNSLEHPMRPTDPDLAYLWDIREAARRVQRHTQGATWERFQSDEMLQDAVARLLGIIGEAVRNLSQRARDEHPEIPWVPMIGLRNVLIHQYFRINLKEIWDIVENDIPVLLQNIEPQLPPDDAT
jgi:uncharacterized protein with HEPN domain/predicted nucleotidyltransferase